MFLHQAPTGMPGNVTASEQTALGSASQLLLNIRGSDARWQHRGHPRTAHEGPHLAAGLDHDVRAIDAHQAVTNHRLARGVLVVRKIIAQYLPKVWQRRSAPGHGI